MCVYRTRKNYVHHQVKRYIYIKGKGRGHCTWACLHDGMLPPLTTYIYQQHPPPLYRYEIYSTRISHSANDDNVDDEDDDDDDTTIWPSHESSLHWETGAWMNST